MFLLVQVLFLIVSPLTGGFHYKVWSMLDSALLISSIGITALVPVLFSPISQRLTMRVAVLLYVGAILDMSANVLVSGWIGWKHFPLD